GEGVQRLELAPRIEQAPELVELQPLVGHGEVEELAGIAKLGQPAIVEQALELFHQLELAPTLQVNDHQAGIEIAPAGVEYAARIDEHAAGHAGLGIGQRGSGGGMVEQVQLGDALDRGAHQHIAVERHDLPEVARQEFAKQQPRIAEIGDAGVRRSLFRYPAENAVGVEIVERQRGAELGGNVLQ